MHINCPHCHNGVEVIEEASLSDVDCPCCGSQFSILGPDPNATVKEGMATQTIGRFELVNQVGMGAFGTVWRGNDPQLDRTVAVKIPRKGKLDKNESEHFFREARAVAQLKHPNIVPVHEIGKDGDMIYIVSEFVQGVTLADRLTAGPVGMRESALLCAKVSSALHHAHEKGVVHRDLKPGNIMLDERDEPHVMDFGLAKREAGEITMTVEGRLLGTPAYMSPEQAAGNAHTADRRTDMYSVGVILFELLTGELPFRGNTRMLIHQVINEDAPSPSRLNANIDRDLSTITLKCLEKDPEKRYATAQKLADDLNRHLNNEPIEARPVGSFERTWRWCKRKPALASAISIATLLLTILAVAGPIIAYHFATLAKSEESLKTAAQEQNKLAIAAKVDAIKAKQKAELETARAESEKRVAVAVRKFLQSSLLRQADVFIQANDGPNPVVNKNLTVLEALEKAAREFSPGNIGKKFPDQPEVQAEILETIAGTMSALGQHETAIEFVSAAIKTRFQNAAVPFPPNLLVAKVDRVFILLNATEHLKAASAFADTISSIYKLLDLKEEDFEQSAERLDVNLEIDRRMDAVFEALIGHCDPRNGVIPEFVADENLKTADYLLIVPKMIMSAVQLQSIHQKLSERYGENDIRTNYARFIVGLLHHAVADIKLRIGTRASAVASFADGGFGTFEKAISNYNRCLENFNQQFPSTDMRIAGLQIVMGIAYQRRGNEGDQARALDCFEQSRNVLTAELHQQHPALLMVNGLYGSMLVEMDRNREAIPVLKRLADQRRALLGPDDRETIQAIFTLAQAMIQLDNSNEQVRRQERLKAIEVFKEAYALSVNHFGIDHFDTSVVANDLAFAYRRVGDWANAAAQFENAWRYRSQNLQRDFVDFTYTLSLLGYCLQKIDDHKKAADYLEMLAKVRYQHYRTYNHPIVITDHLRLASAYRALNDQVSMKATLKKIGREKIGESAFTTRGVGKMDNADFNELHQLGWVVSDIEVNQSDEEVIVERDYKLTDEVTFYLRTKIERAQIEDLKTKLKQRDYELIKLIPYEVDDAHFTTGLRHKKTAATN